jgi:hypothetical protein
MENDSAGTDNVAAANARHRVRLPGFIATEEVGLGDLVRRTTYALGFESCGGCERRAAVLNRWLSISGGRSG